MLSYKRFFYAGLIKKIEERNDNWFFLIPTLFYCADFTGKYFGCYIFIWSFAMRIHKTIKVEGD